MWAPLRYRIFHYILILFSLLLFIGSLSEGAGAMEGALEGKGVPGVNDLEIGVIDLGVVSHEENLALSMSGFHIEGEGHASLRQMLESGRWKKVGDNAGMLEKPRQYSTLWLKALLKNSSDKHVVRWLDLSPWRLNEVNAWLVEPDTLDIRKEIATGLKVPLDSREVDSNKAIIPVELYPGESLLLVTRVFSDSRPFLDINSWDPVAFSMGEMAEWQFHFMLLAAILTLFAVLLITFDFRYILLGAWLLVIFIFESEKEGYISQVFLSSLFDYSGNLRFSTWILTEALFILTSVYILGINKHKAWRWLSAVVLLVTVLFSVLTFIISGDVIRNIGNSIDISFSIVWLMMIPAALGVDRKYQHALIGALALWWLASNFILIGYVTNLYYTASFAEIKIFSGIAMVLSLLLIYSVQKRSYEAGLEQRLRDSERAQRESLERLVARRTNDLNQALDDAHRANEEKTLFLGRISHDLKSPLTSISGYAQLLCAEDGRSATFGRIIHSSATHMNKLIERLIGYARGAVSNGERLSVLHIESFFSDIRQEAEVLVRKNDNQFSMSIRVGDTPFVQCDEVSLRQVIINLVDNAAKYTTSGTVTLDVLCHDALDQTGRIALDVTVRDTGCGISQELQQRLFDPFARESRDSKGTGLGLAIVKDLVTAMEGTVSISSEPEVGTEAHVFLPVETGDESWAFDETTTTTKALLPSYHVDGLTAWVVEDAPLILDLLGGDLSAMGFTVKRFQSGSEVVSAIKAPGTVPDLVVTDYRLQSLSGDEVLMAVKARYAEVPVILISATWSVLRSRSQQDGGPEYAACLSKPINLVDFRREVARVCALESDSPVNEVAPGDKRPPPDMSHLRELLTLGAVSDIIDWCDSFAAAFPSQADVAFRLRHLAELGDFSAIEEAIKTHQ
ncbi:MAG: ATP-binding protein [Pseudomonadota bacterium]